MIGLGPVAQVPDLLGAESDIDYPMSLSTPPATLALMMEKNANEGEARIA
jgi:hypothetical protein